MRPFRFLCALAFLALAAAPMAPAQAADLRVTAFGVLYEFDPFTRRGVTLQDRALLEVRSDGCWNGVTRILNENDFARTVTVTVVFTNSRGHVIARVPMVSATDVGADGSATVNERGCIGALARSVGSLQSLGVARVFSVR